VARSRCAIRLLLSCPEHNRCNDDTNSTLTYGPSETLLLRKRELNVEQRAFPIVCAPEKRVKKISNTNLDFQ